MHLFWSHPPSSRECPGLHGKGPLEPYRKEMRPFERNSCFEYIPCNFVIFLLLSTFSRYPSSVTSGTEWGYPRNHNLQEPRITAAAGSLVVCASLPDFNIYPSSIL